MDVKKLAAYLPGFSDEMEKIAEAEKEAGALKKLFGGLALAGTLAGGAKAMTKAPAAGSMASNMTQTVRGSLGGAGSNARTLAQYGIRG